MILGIERVLVFLFGKRKGEKGGGGGGGVVLKPSKSNTVGEYVLFL